MRRASGGLNIAIDCCPHVFTGPDQVDCISSTAHSGLTQYEAQRERSVLTQERAAQREVLEVERAKADYAIAQQRSVLESERAALTAQAQELAALREQLDRERALIREVQADWAAMLPEFAKFEALCGALRDAA
jgi:hypothetical protein